MRIHWIGCVILLGTSLCSAQVPENLVVEGVPPIPAELRRDASRYLEFRAASFQSWHPERREMLITTRFADVPQVHLVRQPGGARRQLTFLTEPVGGAGFRPGNGGQFLFSQDTGGGEFYQLFRYDVAEGRVTLLTDGKSRNTGARWARSGRQIAYTSTRRNGADNDVHVMDPSNPGGNRLVLEVKGGGWAVLDWSPDEKQLLLGEGISVNESYLHLLDLESGKVSLLTPRGADKIVYDGGQFSRDGRSIYTTTDRGSEFQRLVRLDLATRAETVLTADIPWDVAGFDLSPDGSRLAFTANEDGASVLRVIDVATGRSLPLPAVPAGVISGLEWHANGVDLGFSLNSARSPTDAYAINLSRGTLERWTESETGGLNPASLVEPELVRIKSFDGLAMSGFLYRPDPARFPGPRPVIVIIHGGPEGQSQPIFQGRYNYLLNELGVAIFHPNVRGSTGYGKTFVTLDNGFKREDSVKDIGAFLKRLKADPGIDPARVAVMGGSYGGYMTLASMIHYNDELRCGIDIVGISNFLTFLKNTQSYRRDLRRVEYGDERDPAMAGFLARIAPTANAAKIRKPLFVVQGLNDPRVPVTEAEQMVKAVRDAGGTAWYLMARDEGHGFQKKRNADFQFFSSVLFFQQHLLK